MIDTGWRGGRSWRRQDSRIAQLRLGLTVAGIILWGYGAHRDIEWLRWSGIGLFVVTLVLGFWKRGPVEYADERDDQPR